MLKKKKKMNYSYLLNIFQMNVSSLPVIFCILNVNDVGLSLVRL